MSATVHPTAIVSRSGVGDDVRSAVAVVGPDASGRRSVIAGVATLERNVRLGRRARRHR
jgi:UDP-3-O-[3-hydroxymyristoyl] glucosamine N-acyltransferase